QGAAADRAALAGQDEEHRLAGVLGVLGMADDAPTGAENERTVSADERSEGGLVAVAEAAQEGVIRQDLHALSFDQVVDVSGNKVGRAVGHGSRSSRRSTRRETRMRGGGMKKSGRPVGSPAKRLGLLRGRYCPNTPIQKLNTCFWSP